MQDTNNMLFIIPDTSSFPSGGNEYNKRLTENLQKSGISIKICPIAEVPNQVHHKIVIWDSIYLFEKKNLKEGTHYLLVHHLESLYPPKGWKRIDFLDQKERKHLDKFDGFITSSPYTTAYLKSAKFDQKPIITIPPAIDFLPKITTNPIRTPIRIVLVANIIKRKGILHFLQQLTAKNITNINVKIIGSPDLEPRYVKKCTLFWNGSNNIHFLGSLPQADILRIYEQSDLFISTSYMETYGMAIQEAIAHGLPLLLLDGGNVKNHLQNGNGILCKTMEELTDILLKLSNEIPLINHYKQNAIQLAQRSNRTWNDAARELVAYLNKEK